MSTLRNLGDPQQIRPSIRRIDFGYGDPIGVHQLTDGREAWVIWTYHTQTHVHVIVWVPGHPEFETIENIARFNAAGRTEFILQQFES